MREDLATILKAIREPDDSDIVGQLTPDEFRFAVRSVTDPEVRKQLRATRRIAHHRRWRESNRERERERMREYYYERRASMSDEELAEVRRRDRERKARDRTG